MMGSRSRAVGKVRSALGSEQLLQAYQIQNSEKSSIRSSGLPLQLTRSLPCAGQDRNCLALQLLAPGLEQLMPSLVLVCVPVKREP